MMSTSKRVITFKRLHEVVFGDILHHMCDPRVAEHMPLLNANWDHDDVVKFVAAKEKYWTRDGLGHWAILCDGNYIGWGGFQKEGADWDYGLVLKPTAFGLGARISKKALAFAVKDERIAYVTFLLPPSRKKLGALARLGATFLREIDYNGHTFLKYRLDTK